ncbi:ATP-binding cassette domain-containing protein [Actinoplanes sp. HUAS TT8]|uniref:ABC transporter ATP-binding protein n=1 Tax=Actinoplanes sp. HUAS TT8 TaxID=3447453 RepID=UPI003F51D5D4
MSVLSATGAGVRHHRRWLLRDLDLTVGPGETVAVAGPPGSGRTSTLLALAGRLRLSTGKVSLFGTAALAHVAGVNDPEPVFTVREHVRERLALLGRPRREAAEVELHGLDPDLPGRDLTPYQKQVLGLILARLGGPALIALDGVDSGLDAEERAALWALIGELTAEGVAVLVTAREVDPGRVARVVHLSDPQSGEPGRAVVKESPAAVDEPVPVDEPAPVDESEPVPVDEPEPVPVDEPDPVSDAAAMNDDVAPVSDEETAETPEPTEKAEIAATDESPAAEDRGEK